MGKPIVVVPPPVKEPEVTATPPRDEPKPATPAVVKTEKQDDKPKFKLRTKEDKPTLKPKVSGFLDWGKAKTKQKDGDIMKEDAKAQMEKGKDEAAKEVNDGVKQEKSKTDKARSKPVVKKSFQSSPEAEAKASSPEAESSKKSKPEEKVSTAYHCNDLVLILWSC